MARRACRVAPRAVSFVYPVMRGRHPMHPPRSYFVRGYNLAVLLRIRRTNR